ncbi:hypothetical protein EDF56_105144 [Novosphingobium sp. PhB165]|uniref:DUF465 domain-containing protein n=1 Tax=Novosphingobium sp. PhB165 TaxID=2485105 RepID=UPI001051B9CD|nr:DUF465 domain-containing protein [Novosphingobium sp. PhB165]TCM17801.1 hypothetical protein EDF56_105144 [Novosphingobium sp. PhB165]
MTDRMFLLLERYQKLDAQLRRAQGSVRRNLLEIVTLERRKLRIRARLARLFVPPAAVAPSL